MNPLLHSLLLVCDKAWQSLLSLLPYVVIGVIAGELLKFTSWTKLVYRLTSKAPFMSTIAAVLLGMGSPLCTYGTVPVVMQLMKAGIHISPLAAFLSASAMLNPQIFILTWGGLGKDMAIARFISVLLFGLVLGLILYLIPTKWVMSPYSVGNATTGDEILHRHRKKFEIKNFTADVLKNLQFVGFYLMIGVILGASFDVFMPGYWISNLFKPGSWVSVLSASLLGIPLYACGGGVIPLVKTFISQGMSTGAALAFLIVGPATRVTPLIALAAVFRPLFILIYLSLLVVFSVTAGIIYR